MVANQKKFLASYLVISRILELGAETLVSNVQALPAANTLQVRSFTFANELQQRQLCDFLLYLGEANANPDQPNLLPGAGKRFLQ